MKYRNASHVLPDKLLKEVQKYVSGEAIYIPNNEEKRNGEKAPGQDSFIRNAIGRYRQITKRE